MDTKSKEIIERQMTISKIEKRWNCSTDRAVQLFCKALHLKKPNTDKLEAWSKNKLGKYKPNQSCNCSNTTSCDEGSGCSSCKSCNGSCSC